MLAALMSLGTLTAAPSYADADCDRSAEYCEISDGGEGGGGGGSGGGGGGGGEPPKVPLCSSFPPEAVPEDPPEPDWIFIECRLSSTEEDTIGLWVPPRESAEAGRLVVDCPVAVEAGGDRSDAAGPGCDDGGGYSGGVVVGG